MPHTMKILPACLLVACALLAACSADDAPSPAYPDDKDAPLLPEKHWIPNWLNDTLYGIVPSATGGVKDTLYSYRVDDTSFIRYKGRSYYLWTAANPYSPNVKTYNHCYISLKPFDAASAIAGHMLFTVEPGIFRSDYTGDLERQDQTIEDRGLYTFPAPPFPEGIKTFSSKYGN